jgi:hypothetical protein
MGFGGCAALRMGVYWDRIEPTLGDVTDEEVAQARQAQADAQRAAAAEARLKASGPRKPPVLIRPAAGVPLVDVSAPKDDVMYPRTVVPPQLKGK